MDENVLIARKVISDEDKVKARQACDEIIDLLHDNYKFGS
jgi:hypothetical protein